MGRLIDADALIEWINEQIEQVTKKQVARTSQSIFTREDLVAMQRCLSTFETKINNQPTAFDVEKVVAELESRKELLNIAKMPNTQKNVGQNAYNIAIDIVKAGGVE